MIFHGRYSKTNWENPLAPFIKASIRAKDGQWIEVFFLIDLGADGTYLPSKYAKKLGLQLDEAKTKDDATGVGGQRVEHIPYMTQIRFKSDGDRRTFDLEIGVFTQEEALDLPVLGRDVLNFFTLLCDVRANLVWLMDDVSRTQILQFCETMGTP